MANRRPLRGAFIIPPPQGAVTDFELDDEQYDLVEYSCHEGNYGMTNILSGARALDREAAEK